MFFWSHRSPHVFCGKYLLLPPVNLIDKVLSSSVNILELTECNGILSERLNLGLSRGTRLPDWINCTI
jgi:hypothetical protein